MALFVTIDDFVGEIAIPRDKYTEANLQGYLDKYEKNLLIELLGAELYKAFIKDYTEANPDANKFTEDRYIAIFNEIILDESDCVLIRSEGIPKMLQYMIYFYFTRDLNFKMTIGGSVNNLQADAKESLFDATNMITIYNEGVKTWNWIQYYLDCYNPENYDYKNFNGRVRNFNSAI